MAGILTLGWAVVQGQTSTDTATEQVQIEEYVPRVIIEGKWGTGPGEFGIYYDINEAEQFGIPYPTPNSIAVNSKGEIYILDLLNNRIQKFDSEGKYLLSISVFGLTNEKGESSIMSSPYSGLITGLKTDTIFGLSDKPVKIKGINIVIDSQDNLYYYLIRQKENKGEVWQFKDDKLVRKWEVPVGGYISAGQGMVLDDIDVSLWLYSICDTKGKSQYDKHYEVKEKKVYTNKEHEKRKKKIEEEYKKHGTKKTTPSERLKQFDFEVTNEGVRVIRRYETK